MPARLDREESERRGLEMVVGRSDGGVRTLVIWTMRMLERIVEFVMVVWGLLG